VCATRKTRRFWGREGGVWSLAGESRRETFCMGKGIDLGYGMRFKIVGARVVGGGKGGTRAGIFSFRVLPNY
jgi:hypothetical protein